MQWASTVRSLEPARASPTHTHQDDALENADGAADLVESQLPVEEAMDAPAAVGHGKANHAIPSNKQVHINHARRRPRIIQRPSLFDI